MSVIKSLVIAFSMYSKIPMPHLELEEKDMRYVMGFFPLAGLVIGAVIYGAKPSAFKFKNLGFHEIFHIFILLGSLCHFFSVFQYVI